MPLRKRLFEGRGLPTRPRYGVSSVEFAMVCPLVFLILFGMIEMSRAVTISETVKTGLVACSREATIRRTNATNVAAEAERLFDIFGINDYAITVTPEVIDETVPEVNVSINVGFNGDNGMALGRFTQGRRFQMQLNIPR